MDSTITAKLNLVSMPEQFRQLRLTQLAYRDALHQASQPVFAHGKTSSSQRLPHALYGEVRATPGLPSRDARVVSSARWAPPPKGSGPSGITMWQHAKPAGPGNAA